MVWQCGSTPRMYPGFWWRIHKFDVGEYTSLMLENTQFYYRKPLKVLENTQFFGGEYTSLMLENTQFLLQEIPQGT
jgi:hypothetical protein